MDFVGKQCPNFLKQQDIKIALIVLINHGYLPLSYLGERNFWWA